MADVGVEFTNYLKAYALEDYYKLCGDKVEDSLMSAIYAKHHSQFDAWLKVPEQYRVYGRVYPPEVLEQAKRDPNFTEADAEKAKKQAEEKKSPYSLEPYGLADYPAYKDLSAQGFHLTPHHIAIMMLIKEDTYKRGYSLEASEKFSAQTLFIRAYEQLPQTPENKQKRRQLQEERLKNLKEDLIKSQPERAFIRLLRDVKNKKTSAYTATPVLNEYMQNIVHLNRIENLALQMNSPMFTNGGEKSVENQTRMLWENALIYPNNIRLRVEKMRKSLPSSYPDLQINPAQRNSLNILLQKRKNGNNI